MAKAFDNTCSCQLKSFAVFPFYIHKSKTNANQYFYIKKQIKYSNFNVL